LGGYYKSVNLYGIYRVIFNSLELLTSLRVNYSICNIMSVVRTLPSKGKQCWVWFFTCVCS